MLLSGGISQVGVVIFSTRNPWRPFSVLCVHDTACHCKEIWKRRWCYISPCIRCSISSAILHEQDVAKRFRSSSREFWNLAVVARILSTTCCGAHAGYICVPERGDGLCRSSYAATPPASKYFLCCFCERGNLCGIGELGDNSALGLAAVETVALARMGGVLVQYGSKQESQLGYLSILLVLHISFAKGPPGRSTAVSRGHVLRMAAADWLCRTCSRICGPVLFAAPQGASLHLLRHPNFQHGSCRWPCTTVSKSRQAAMAVSDGRGLLATDLIGLCGHERHFSKQLSWCLCVATTPRSISH
mmetsp:Transcript_45169/g.73588  ORF Transcript_45169/g.73588 Transcript_45169/m.73588 type:complete len:302 (+) Transcript_45169:216-1121(+)